MIIPAIDLIGGRVTRLAQGDFARSTGYDFDPRELIREYAEAGATLLHIVDLDGARNPDAGQGALISELIAGANVSLQVGGGIRSIETASALLEAGASRIVIGSLAVSTPSAIAELIQSFGAERIVASLDVSLNEAGTPMVMTHGWEASSGKDLASVLQPLVDSGLAHVLCTDIARDGMGNSTNNALYADLSAAWPTITWQASGGVGSLEDVAAAKRSGAQSLIIGKALLDKKFSAKEAIICWQNA